MENGYFKNGKFILKNISQYYCFGCILDQINAALVQFHNTTT